MNEELFQNIMLQKFVHYFDNIGLIFLMVRMYPPHKVEEVLSLRLQLKDDEAWTKEIGLVIQKV